MLAVRFYKPGDLRAEQVPIPEAGSGELVVRSSVALTCGTDLKMFKRGHPLSKPPQIMGHEFAGIISSVGQGVEQFKPGMRVVTANSAPCKRASCTWSSPMGPPPMIIAVPLGMKPIKSHPCTTQAKGSKLATSSNGTPSGTWKVFCRTILEGILTYSAYAPGHVNPRILSSNRSQRFG